MLFRAGGALDALALLGVALGLGVGAAAAVDGFSGFFRASAMAAAAKSSRMSVFPFRETWFPSPSFPM